MPGSRVVTSAANPIVKTLRLLASDRRARRREGAFVVEGTGPVWRALDAGAVIRTLVAAPDLVAGTAAGRLVAEAESAGVPVVRLSADLLGRLADRDSPAGVLAVVEGSVMPVEQLRLPADAAVVALHEVGNPGNLGTVIRTAECAGIAAVVTVGACTDPYAPGAVKASMGSLFAVPVAHAATGDGFLEWARAAGLRVVACTGRASASLWETELTGGVALLLGSEGEGLPEALVAAADVAARIPMTGGADSLNLAVAAGIAMYEARRPVLGR